MIQIAPGVACDNWRSLQLDEPHGADWESAIEIVRKRFVERYFEPVDALIGLEKDTSPANRKYGFAILAIDCLLIEALAAFVEGLVDTRWKSTEISVRFLSTSEQFKKTFTEDLATRFYHEFRCGILHLAEVKQGNRVWSVGELLTIEGKHLRINRNEFHARLKLQFETYINQLRDPANALLRKNLRTKMDFLCDLARFD